MIAHLVAISENNVIGTNGQLPWHLPNDLKYFKNLTWGGVVIMGRKTFESVNKPLPGRLNIVVTSNPNWKADGVVTASGVDAAIDYAYHEHFKEIFIIGGGEIFRQTMNIADVLYITRVHTQLDGDTYYPEVEKDKYVCIFSEAHEADEKHAYAYTFETWKRKTG